MENESWRSLDMMTLVPAPWAPLFDGDDDIVGMSFLISSDFDFDFDSYLQSTVHSIK